MSETNRELTREISPAQQRIFVGKIKELLPNLTPGYLGALSLGRDGISYTYDISEGGTVVMEAEESHKLADEDLRIQWSEWEDYWQARVGVSVESIRTEEGVFVCVLYIYNVENEMASFGQNASIFKRAQPATVEELREIFTPEYLQSILEEYEKLKSAMEASDAKVFTVQRFNDIMAKLDQLGPHTLDQLAA